jgi:hypothetical protein
MPKSIILYTTIDSRCAGSNLVPDRLALIRIAPVKLVFVKSQYLKFAPIKKVKDRSVLSNISLDILAFRRHELSKYAPRISAPDKTAFFRNILFKLAPFRFIVGDVSISLASCKNCNASALRLGSNCRKADRA